MDGCGSPLLLLVLLLLLLMSVRVHDDLHASCQQLDLHIRFLLTRAPCSLNSRPLFADPSAGTVGTAGLHA